MSPRMTMGILSTSKRKTRIGSPTKDSLSKSKIVMNKRDKGLSSKMKNSKKRKNP